MIRQMSAAVEKLDWDQMDTVLFVDDSRQSYEPRRQLASSGFAACAAHPRHGVGKGAPSVSMGIFRRWIPSATSTPGSLRLGGATAAWGTPARALPLIATRPRRPGTVAILARRRRGNFGCQQLR
jgi:hypothetical protein